MRHLGTTELLDNLETKAKQQRCGIGLVHLLPCPVSSPAATRRPKPSVEVLAVAMLQNGDPKANNHQIRASSTTTEVDCCCPVLIMSNLCFIPQP